MLLFRHGAPGQEGPGIVDRNGKLRDLTDRVADITSETIGAGIVAQISGLDPAELPLLPEGTRIGPCVGKVGKFVCVGLNYLDHAAEAGMPTPAEPILFMKATTSIVGPNDDVIMPRGAEKLDWEVELGIVIGSVARDIEEDAAEACIAGYCVVNDVSERSFQLERGGQWLKGKSADSFGPIGPYMVARAAVADPHNLDLWLEVDGHRYQNGNTSNMIFKVPFLVSYISRFMTLMPGDIIATGTPAGVGMGQRPPVYLKDGAQMRLCVSGLGEQAQTVRTRGTAT
ncbi:MAG: 2-keto-4-pentenoate hydratase/2-oxohepta-3-ene-1,7-dioic acid hydratase (catechol pathway) [Rhodobacteraceae bacterium HLUCCA08]|nr:MAG: 2-keto-4-pentenoate hydratase/2-oxohepta-3-ene-1,7-dioic acid hydratase (catechol pathway) [Rhodobacteraceae bacterium HLUCCA08]